MIEEKEKNIRNGVTKKRIIFIITILGVMLVTLGVYKVVSKLTAKEVSTTAGIKVLKELESKDTLAIENKITEKDKSEEDAWNARTSKEKFANTVIMGDSISQGLYEFDILDAATVIADKGIELQELTEHINKVIALKPKVLFLAYGMNDIKSTRGDSVVFKGQYEAVIKQLKEALPETDIYINCILPVQQQKIDIEPEFASLAQYNIVIKELCEEEKVGYIDNTELVKEEYYTEDGVHMHPEFYTFWVDHMAEVAKL